MGLAGFVWQPGAKRMTARSGTTVRENLFQEEEEEERDEKEAEKPDCRRKDEDVPKMEASAEQNDLMKSHLTRIL